MDNIATDEELAAIIFTVAFRTDVVQLKVEGKSHGKSTHIAKHKKYILCDGIA